MSSARIRLLGAAVEAVREPPRTPFLREKFPLEAGAAAVGRGGSGCDGGAGVPACEEAVGVEPAMPLLL
jgi:hypothetical protein